LPVDGQGYLTGEAPGVPEGAIGTQMGVRHCMPAAQSPGPWQGHEHLPAAVLHLCVTH
jgi:hypothetical protein